MLDNLAGYYEDEVQQATQQLMGFVSSGANAFHSVYANVSLQTSAQMITNQLREYIVDCNGGVCYAADVLYIVDVNDDGTITENMCSASQPSWRARQEAIRREKHFFPNNTFPPYPELTEKMASSCGKWAMYLLFSSSSAVEWRPFIKFRLSPKASYTFVLTRAIMAMEVVVVFPWVPEMHRALR